MRVLIAITLGYGLVYTCRLALSVVKKPLIDEGIFTPVELGFIGAGLFYGYAVGKLVNGFLADHANMKVFFAFGVMLSAVANLGMGDRKSTRLNSSHVKISYAVFCLKKKR